MVEQERALMFDDFNDDIELTLLLHKTMHDMHEYGHVYAKHHFGIIPNANILNLPRAAQKQINYRTFDGNIKRDYMLSDWYTKDLLEECCADLHIDTETPNDKQVHCIIVMVLRIIDRVPLVQGFAKNKLDGIIDNFNKILGRVYNIQCDQAFANNNNDSLPMSTIQYMARLIIKLNASRPQPAFECNDTDLGLVFACMENNMTASGAPQCRIVVDTKQLTKSEKQFFTAKKPIVKTGPTTTLSGIKVEKPVKELDMKRKNDTTQNQPIVQEIPPGSEIVLYSLGSFMCGRNPTDIIPVYIDNLIRDHGAKHCKLSRHKVLLYNFLGMLIYYKEYYTGNEPTPSKINISIACISPSVSIADLFDGFDVYDVVMTDKHPSFDNPTKMHDRLQIADYKKFEIPDTPTKYRNYIYYPKNTNNKLIPLNWFTIKRYNRSIYDLFASQLYARVVFQCLIEDTIANHRYHVNVPRVYKDTFKSIRDCVFTDTTTKSTYDTLKHMYTAVKNYAEEQNTIYYARFSCNDTGLPDFKDENSLLNKWREVFRTITNKRKQTEANAYELFILFSKMFGHNDIRSISIDDKDINVNITIENIFYNNCEALIERITLLNKTFATPVINGIPLTSDITRNIEKYFINKTTRKTVSSNGLKINYSYATMVSSIVTRAFAWLINYASGTNNIQLERLISGLQREINSKSVDIAKHVSVDFDEREKLIGDFIDKKCAIYKKDDPNTVINRQVFISIMPSDANDPFYGQFYTPLRAYYQHTRTDNMTENIGTLTKHVINTLIYNSRLSPSVVCFAPAKSRTDKRRDYICPSPEIMCLCMFGEIYASPFSGIHDGFDLILGDNVQNFRDTTCPEIVFATLQELPCITTYKISRKNSSVSIITKKSILSDIKYYITFTAISLIDYIKKDKTFGFVQYLMNDDTVTNGMLRSSTRRLLQVDLDEITYSVANPSDKVQTPAISILTNAKTEQTKADIADYEQAYTECDDGIVTAQQKIDALQSDIKTFYAEIEQCKVEIEHLEPKRKKIETNINHLTKKREKTKHSVFSITEYERELIEINTEIATLHQHIDQAQRDYENTIEPLKENIDEFVVYIRDEIDPQLKFYKSRLSDKTNSGSEIEEIKTGIADCDEARAQCNVGIATLHQHIDQAQRERDNIVKPLKEKIDALEEIKTGIADCDEARAQCNVGIATLHQHIDQAQRERDNIVKPLKEKIDALEEIKSDKIDSHPDKLNSLSRNKTNLDNEIDQLKVKIASRDKDIIDIETEIDELKAHISDLISYKDRSITPVLTSLSKIIKKK